MKKLKPELLASDLGLKSDSREWLDICFVRTVLRQWKREKIQEYLSKQTEGRREHLRSLLNEWMSERR